MKKNHRAVLLMADETLADVLSKALRLADYRVSVKQDVGGLIEEEAWDRDIDLIATALRLPDGDAFQLIEILAQRRYAGRVLFVADSPPVLLEAAVDLATERGLNVVGSFESPFSLRAMVQALGDHPSAPARTAAMGEVGELADGELEAALSQGRIEAVYQPKVDLRSGALGGVEALARWNHESLGLLPPSRFIRRAEADELIHSLTEEIVRQSLRDLHEFRRYAPRARTAINLSGVSLGRRDLPERMQALTAAAGLSPDHVIFEVTETQMLMDIGHAMSNVNRLRLMNFGLALDDYGTGFSSLTRIKSLPFTELKVDRRFVDGAANRSSLVRILENCVSLGRNLGMTVVAEGVETEEDWELVRSLGFHMVQGFYESPPLRRHELIEWLSRRYGETV